MSNMAISVNFFDKRLSLYYKCHTGKWTVPQAVRSHPLRVAFFMDQKYDSLPA